jgi:catechol 2,3-dioxygenase-like lactoylglutathione lyase family enzyme
MQPLALNHVAVQVSDLDRSQHFYETVLRLTPIERPAFDFSGLWYRLGTEQELHLIRRGPAAPNRPQRDNHFALLVDDIDAWEAHLKQAGARYQPRKRRPDGALQIFIIDPDGHHIELCTRPPDSSGAYS